jgi:hypothetical protein
MRTSNVQSARTVKLRRSSQECREVESPKMPDESRERALEATLFRLYQAWAALPIPPGKSRRYYAERFRQLIVPGCVNYKGGVGAVQGILSKPTAGFERLKPYPHLTVEYLVLLGHKRTF